MEKKKFKFTFQPAHAVAQYDNEGAFQQMLSMMKRGERIDLKLFTSKDNHPSVWAESRTVAGFRYDVSSESFDSLLLYLQTGNYEPFEKCQSESDELDEGTDFQMMIMKQFVEGGVLLQYVPQFREYTDKVTASISYQKGKILFRVNRTQELMDYLRENNQII
jgi:hypothetical protein